MRIAITLVTAILVLSIGIIGNNPNNQNELENEVAQITSKLPTRVDNTGTDTGEVMGESFVVEDTKEQQVFLPINDYIYPNSNILSQTERAVVLSSTDSPDTITNWYKNKIESKDMGAQSFVTTSANGEILSKLSAADGNIEINVEISKAAQQKSVNIKVELTVN